MAPPEQPPLPLLSPTLVALVEPLGLIFVTPLKRVKRRGPLWRQRTTASQRIHMIPADWVEHYEASGPWRKGGEKNKDKKKNERLIKFFHVMVATKH